MVNHREWYFFL